MNPPRNNAPAWRSDYPIRQSDEHRVTRRQFAKFAGCSALAFGATWLGKDALFATRVATEPKLAATLNELSIGRSKLFRYPTEDDPCILVRLAENAFAAYSQRCTHLRCPVHFNAEASQLVCPCHEGFFSAADGRVLAGPPRRPLPRYRVEIRGEEIWVLPPDGTIS
jgi:nitrite reductase/ring-hydroxylating ferredoxin subunit